MLTGEGWAEIRRLHRAEGMSIKVVARVTGCLEEHGEGRAAQRRTAEIRAAATGLVG